MSQSPRPKSQTTARSSHPMFLMVSTAADTTWRMFVPLIGFTILGVWIDRSFHIRPFATITCLIIGTALAAFLVVLQYRRVGGYHD